MERTFVMVKPDGVQRGLAGKVIGAIEQKGYKLVALKMLQIDEELAQKHYAEHKEKNFYTDLLSFITSGPVIAMIWEGPDVVAAVRNIMGSTNPVEAYPGSIRGTYASEMSRNVVHGSDSLQSAQREIELYFRPEEIMTY